MKRFLPIIVCCYQSFPARQLEAAISKNYDYATGILSECEARAGHGSPRQNPIAFNAAVLEFMVHNRGNDR